MSLPLLDLYLVLLLDHQTNIFFYFINKITKININVQDLYNTLHIMNLSFLHLEDCVNLIVILLVLLILINYW